MLYRITTEIRTNTKGEALMYFYPFYRERECHDWSPILVEPSLYDKYDTYIEALEVIKEHDSKALQVSYTHHETNLQEQK